MDFMAVAVAEARKAARRGEVPVGCVIVCGDKIIAKGANQRERRQNALWHAEIVAINRACRKKKSWRLDDCVMYVTLAPCAMCLGAIQNARLAHVYYGAESTSDLNWHAPVEYVPCAAARDILVAFFRERR